MSLHHPQPEAFDIVAGTDVAQILTVDHVQRFTCHHLEGIFSGTRVDKDDPVAQAKVDEQREESRIRILTSLTDMAVAGDLVIARVEGMVAAVAGSKEAGTMPDGRSVYEIKRVSVLPEFRGRRLSAMLMNYVSQQLRDTYPVSPQLIHTKDSRIRGWAERHGFLHLPLWDVLRIWQPDVELDDAIRRWLEDEEGEGWGGYLFDPQKLARKSSTVA